MTVSETARPIEEVSIADVAEKAGVSVATVSRVLNGHTNVRQPTREKVLAAVEESGYRINELARNLRTAESRLLLTMVPDFGNPFYAEIVRGIDSVARQNGYFMLLCDTGADPGRERSYFDLLRGRRADGAICLDPAAVQKALAEEAIGAAVGRVLRVRSGGGRAVRRHRQLPRRRRRRAPPDRTRASQASR